MSEQTDHPSAEGPGPWRDATAELVTGLVFRYLDHALGSDEAERLNALLLRYEQARELMALLSIERFVLRDVLVARDATENNRGTLLSELAELEAQAVTAGPVDITEQILAREAAKTHAAPPPPIDRGPTVVVIPRAVVWFGVAAALILCVSLAWPWITREDQAAPSVSAPAEVEDHAATVAAVVTKAYSPKPGADPGPATGQDVLIGERVVVTSGLVELVSQEGVRLVVQGPSSFRFDAALQLSMDEGRLMAQVDERGQGFTVTTPNGRVVDHGTEFGVRYDPARGVLEASVFDGSVSLQSNALDATPRRLTGGWGGRVDTEGRVSVQAQQPADAARQSYVRVLPETGYAQEVLRLEPAAFWAFDAVSEEQEALNHFNHWVFRGRYHGGASPDLTERTGAAAGFGRAPRLNGSSYFDFGDVLDFEADQAFTFAFWLRPEADVIGGSVLSRMSVSDDFRGYDIYLEKDRLLFQLKHAFIGDHVPEQNDALRVEVRGLSDRRWAHVVLAYDGSRSASGVTAYINGRPTQTRVLSDTLTGTIRSDAPFRVGRRLEKPGRKSPGDGLAHGSFFTGSIDELMVFRRGLSRDEVRGLYRAANDPSQGLTRQPEAGLASSVSPPPAQEQANETDS